MQVFVEDWAMSYGSPYLLQGEDADAPIALAEDGGRLCFHRPEGDGEPPPSVAFVDGVRRGEATLYQPTTGGGLARGVAGAHACGAVLVSPGRRPVISHERITRLVIWGSGATGELPRTRSGLAWQSQSVDDRSPEAPLLALQARMRRAEGELAEDLARAGHLVIVDGPLQYTRGVDTSLVGYVKTHHRALLEPADHARVPDLLPGERTSLFGLGRERYAAYLRLVARGPLSGPWSGIVRIELPQATGLARAVVQADLATRLLPRFAGVAHRDPRAPQNLQPIGALEARLSHLLGDPGLAARGVREAVLAMSAPGQRQ